MSERDRDPAMPLEHAHAAHGGDHRSRWSAGRGALPPVRRRAGHRSRAERRQRSRRWTPPSPDCRPTGLRALGHAPADVSDIDQVEAVVALAVERFGRLDVLISNAGVLSPNGRIHNLSNGGLGARLSGQRARAPSTASGPRCRSCARSRSGSIVLTASVSGLTAWSHAAPYCATKAAVIQLAKVGGRRVRPGRDPRQLRLPRDVPVGDP